MSQFNKDIQNALLGTGMSLKEIFRQRLGQTINQLLKTELSAILESVKYFRAVSLSTKYYEE